MGNKIFWLAILWGAIVVTYIILAAAMPTMRAITSETLVSFNASANMSNFPGTYAAVESSPMWLWFIPLLVGIVTSAVILKKK